VQENKIGKEIMTRKSIKIQETENGSKFFYIYEIRAVKHNGEIIRYDRELTKKGAIERKEFVDRTFTKLYKFAFIREHIVWC
jgi:hypothetical protein